MLEISAASTTGTPLSESLVNEAARQQGQARPREVAEHVVAAMLLCDMAVVLYALLASFWLRFYTPLADVGIPAHPSFISYTAYFWLGALLMVLLLFNLNLYERDKLLRVRHNAMQITKAALLWFALMLGLTLIFKIQPPISRIFVALSATNAVLWLLLWRSFFHRRLINSSTAPLLRQRVLFVGWSEEADHLAKVFLSDPSHAHEIMGWVTSPLHCFRKEPPTSSVPQVGNYQDITQIIENSDIDLVILTELDLSKGEIIGLANLCERSLVQFKVIPSFFQILLSGLHLETVSGIPILGVNRLPLDRPINHLVKRLVDIVGALVGLMLSAPIIAVVGYLVRRESPGPIFYRQQRLGYAGRIFEMIKIRSMRLDAEEGGKIGWTQRDDPRRLKIGSVMRSFNVDELPQFWNVLKGEMSLVGPRPERPELIANFKDEIPHYNARHHAKPGMTGWAQVKGLRGDTDLTDRINCDLWYLENWSLLLDIQILVMTLLNRKGAC